MSTDAVIGVPSKNLGDLSKNTNKHYVLCFCSNRSKTQTKLKYSIVKVEELIYNHSLVCGRDGGKSIFEYCQRITKLHYIKGGNNH
jgi:predicted ATPase